jgi:hypothetical protein
LYRLVAEEEQGAFSAGIDPAPLTKNHPSKSWLKTKNPKALAAMRVLGGTLLIVGALQHHRQLWAPRTAWVVHVVRNVLWAVGGKPIEPIDHLGIAATGINQAAQAIATRHARTSRN